MCVCVYVCVCMCVRVCARVEYLKSIKNDVVSILCKDKNEIGNSYEMLIFFKKVLLAFGTFISKSFSIGWSTDETLLTRRELVLSFFFFKSSDFTTELNYELRRQEKVACG